MITKLITILVLALASSTGIAGGVGSVAGFGGASEVTQILNNVQLAASFDQQIVSYQNQLMQYDTMMRNLAKNPTGVTVPNLMQFATNQARIMSVGKDIASSMSKVDSNFASTFQSPAAASLADKFNLWNSSSQDALKASMFNAGLQREQFKDDSTAIQALTTKLEQSDGNVSALQALGGLNAAQLQESMKLRDLISQQQVAQNTYLAAQVNKAQAVESNTDLFTAPYTNTIPQIGGDKMKIIQWKTNN